MIVDSSVLIHLSRIGRLSLLKEFGTIRITEDVYRETVLEAAGKPGTSGIKEACESWVEIVKIRDEVRVKGLAEIEGIENADASLVILAEKFKDTLLTNDYTLMKVANARGVDTLWLTSLILVAVRKEYLRKSEAKQVLLDLIKNGMRLSVEVYAALVKRIDEM